MFNVGNPVKGFNFMDRTKHIPVFKMYLDNCQNVMIKAPRRFGKTSLVKHTFEHLKGYNYIYIDIRRATNLTSLANDIINHAYVFGGIESFIDKAKSSIVDLFKTIQKVKLDKIAEVTLKHVENQTDETEYYLHALDVVEKIAVAKNIKIKLVFDEFQDIITIASKEILDKSRSVMQHHENITYIFLGSAESIMTKIFENKSSSFFHFTQIMNLGGLDVYEVLNYAVKAFKKEKIKFKEDDIKKTLVFLEGHPDYTAQTLQHIYISSLLSSKEIVLKDCLQSLCIVLNNNKAYIDEVIQRTKGKKHHFEVLSALANGVAVELNSKTLYQVKRSLEESGLIKNINRGEYIVTDIFIKTYLQDDMTDSAIALRHIGSKLLSA